jgi:hypothetical protein
MPHKNVIKAIISMVSGVPAAAGFRCQEKREPRNTEQGIMNVEVLMNAKTSLFEILDFRSRL